jgi:hypothetical protein
LQASLLPCKKKFLKRIVPMVGCLKLPLNIALALFVVTFFDCEIKMGEGLETRITIERSNGAGNVPKVKVWEKRQVDDLQIRSKPLSFETALRRLPDAMTEAFVEDTWTEEAESDWGGGEGSEGGRKAALVEDGNGSSADEAGEREVGGGTEEVTPAAAAEGNGDVASGAKEKERQKDGEEVTHEEGANGNRSSAEESGGHGTETEDGGGPMPMKVVTPAAKGDGDVTSEAKEEEGQQDGEGETAKEMRVKRKAPGGEHASGKEHHAGSSLEDPIKMKLWFP